MKATKLTYFSIVFLFFFCASAYAQISWSPIGPGGGGWLTAITVVNDDANTVYVSCDVGGIYKSEDHGASWKIMNEGLTSYDISDIAYDPTDPLTLYAASRGGVFKSTDGGLHWNIKRNNFPDEAPFSYSAPIGSVEVDPSNPQIIYAGVGIVREGYYGLTSDHWIDAGTKGTIFKSTNAGDNWQALTVDPDGTAMILGIAIDPVTPTTLYATTSEGIYKSMDAGINWTKKDTDLPHDLTLNLIINPTDPQILHVTLWAEPGSGTWQGGVYKSTNGGNSWNSISNNLPHELHTTEPGLTSNYVSILADKSNPNVMYLGNPSWIDGGVYKTTNGGSSWTFVTETEGNNPNTNTGWIQDGVATKCMAIDPNNPTHVYAGSSKVIIKTIDAGMQWNQVYTNPVGADYWKGRGFQTTVIGDIAIDPTQPNNLYVGYWDMGFQKSTDGGVSFKNTFMDELTIAYKENVFAIVIDPTHTDIIYASTGWWNTNEGELVKSINAGESWDPINNNNTLPKKQVWSLALDKNSPENNRILYAAVFEEGLFKTIDGGQNWFPINNGLGVGDNKRIRKIIIDPNNSNTLFAGFEPKNDYDAETTQQGGLFKSTDAGQNWTRVDDPINLSQINIQDIAIDPNNSQFVYTAVHTDYDHSKGNTYFGGVYKSEDGGSTWAKYNTGFGPETGLRVQTVAVSPLDGNVLYAGTTDSPYHDNSSGRGVFKSTDGGVTWSPINDGVEALYIDDFEISPADPTVLFAGTGGNGLLIAIDNEVALPIEMLDPLTASVSNGSQVLLQWTTASEVHNNGFEIQRSGEDLAFKKIDFISGTNTNTAKTYRVLDPNPLAQNYYRYKQIDLDGQHSFSNIVFTRLPQNQFQIVPNILVDGQLNYQLELNNPAKGSLQIFTQKGVSIQTQDLGLLPKGKTKASLSIELPTGYYYMVVRIGGERMVREFFVEL